jgi:hypothetical protein
LNFEQVELLYSLANGPAADLLNDANTMVGVNDLLAYVEVVTAQHAEPPKDAGPLNPSSLSQLGTKGNFRRPARTSQGLQLTHTQEDKSGEAGFAEARR